LLPLLSQALTQISAWAQVAGIDCNDNFHWFLSDQHSDTFSVFLYHSLERKHCNSLISLNRYSPLWSRSATPLNFKRIILLFLANNLTWSFKPHRWLRWAKVQRT
jgi:hypothetical protein